jgi:4-hydroxybenzoyl-CoA reductase subunit alpha
MKQITIFVNDKEHSLLVNDHEKLSFVLRERIGLTGTKLGCEQGSCGACTVLLDDTPILSCITPALKCNGHRITTIEGIAQNGKLHKLQEKFVEKGAIQCGYCTPGMVISSIGYLKNNANPTIQEIKESISGNLCRCTGYKKIIEAIHEYVSEANGEKLTGKKIHTYGDGQYQIVGKPRPYIEAVKKVKGEAEFTDDIKIKNSLYCRFLRSTYAHAKIDSIDTSEAVKLPGVRAVITGKDLPITFGVLPISENETAMAVEKTRYMGEIVAAVAADTEEIGKNACSLINVKYTPLRPFFEIEESLFDIGTDEKIHSSTKLNNNIHKVAELRFGKQEEGFKNSEYLSELDFNFKGLNHCFTEPHAAAAYWDENGLTVISATQVPHYLHRYLAKVLEVPSNRIRVIKPYLGGGFGGKSDPFPHEIIVAHLSRILGRPMRVRLNREEVFLTNHGRHPTKMSVRLCMDKDHKFTAIDADIKIDGGAYGSFGVVTTYYNGVLLQAPYKIDNFGFKTRRVYTNKPQCGAMRGHGAVNSRFAVETLIDELARKANVDPCELRLKNFMEPYTLTVGEFRITSNGSRESLKAVMEKSKWKDKFGKLPYGEGIGVACGFYISGSALRIHRNEYPQSVVHLKLDLDGRVLITSGASDIGQGSDTMLAIIVAEVLGVTFDNIQVLAADTLLTPIDLGSYSSRVTFMSGNAAKMAAENLRKKILEAVSKQKNVPLDELNIFNERVFSNDKSVDLSWKEAVEIVTAGTGAVTVSGYYNSPKLGGNFKGSGAGLSPSYSFGAVIAQVKINTDTGAVKVENIWGAHDCGRALNPLAVEGQLEGSWHMGLGQALSEEMRYHEGLLLNGNLLDYKVPTSVDTPDMDVTIIESIDPEGPFGAKECGEGGIHPSIPAVANAVYDAVGYRVTSLPIRAEEILNDIKEQKKLQKI